MVRIFFVRWFLYKERFWVKSFFIKKDFGWFCFFGRKTNYFISPTTFTASEM